jgi:hypothetical protein
MVTDREDTRSTGCGKMRGSLWNWEGPTGSRALPFAFEFAAACSSRAATSQMRLSERLKVVALPGRSAAIQHREGAFPTHRYLTTQATVA